jgi:hypothetical protein
MKVDSETTFRVTLTSGEVQQAVLDWVRRNYQGSEASRLTIQEVDFQFEYADHENPQLNDWPEEIALVCGVQSPAKRPAKRRQRAASAKPRRQRGVAVDDFDR